MKRILTMLMLGAAIAAAPVSAADVQVIGNSSVSAELSAADVKDIFLGTKESVGGAAVVPVLASGGAAHEAFLKDLGKTGPALSTYYRSLVFTGKASMPKICATDAEVIEYVSKTKGAIGYVSSAANAAGTKTLDVK